MAQLNGEAATVEGAAHREERLSQLVEVVERVSLEASILAMARLGLTQRRMVGVVPGGRSACTDAAFRSRSVTKGSAFRASDRQRACGPLGGR